MRTPFRILLLLWMVAVVAAACSSGATDQDGDAGSTDEAANFSCSAGF